MTKTMRRRVSAVVALAFMSLQCVVVAPAVADDAADLKNIEYRYYFRGNYEKAIEELQSFLQRPDLDPAHFVEAKEFLAASLIVTGKTAQGKAQYVDILEMNPEYKGPDPSVFKSAIVATYEEARAEYASVVIRNVPETVASPPPVSATGEELASTKPFYKKWWFYATMGAVALVIAGAASGAGDEGTPAETGSVTVNVNVP